MAWTRNGTVGVTNNSINVTGAGTTFITNKVQPGDAININNTGWTEIAGVAANGALTLVEPWLGATAAGLPYKIMPTSSRIGELAQAVSEQTDEVETMLDGPGSGKFADGTAAAPSMRFLNDQDTGIRRAASNVMSLVAGAVDRLVVDSTGSTTYGSSQLVGAEFTNLILGKQGFNAWYLGGSGTPGDNDFTVRIGTAATAIRVSPSGNLLIGADSGSCHVIQKDGAGNGTPIVSFRQAGGVKVAEVYAIDFAGVDAANALNAAMKLGRSATGRSLSVPGTINAGGADYAEYMTKAPSCGTIEKGAMCGVDGQGCLTKTWAAATAGFVVKSSDPGLILGDTWASGVGPRPKPPEPLRDEPQLILPQEPSSFFVDAHRAWAAECQVVRAAHDADHATWVNEAAAHATATAAYEAALPIWQAAFDEAQQNVDRIAFSGQVPLRVDEQTLAACEAALADGEAAYLVAVANGGGIAAQLVRETDMTLPLYMRRLGKLWSITDERREVRDGEEVVIWPAGMAWIDVQHG